MEANEKLPEAQLYSLPARDAALGRSTPLRRTTSGKASETTAAVTNPGSSVQPRGTVVELCCGMGGMGIGLRELGYEVKRAYDIWADAVSIYNHNFGESAARECNLLTAAGRQLVQADREGLGDLELLAAGPPCKGFSQLRNGFHDGRNGHNRVLKAMPDYIALLRPRMFLIENVPALLSHREGRTFEAFILAVEKPAARLRYRVEYGVYDAAGCGTPQARNRGPCQ
jgi:DNA (cytosine-5)-methyltransferase 1